MICECGILLDPGEDQCPYCADAPHDRECPCSECEAYWAGVFKETVQ